MEISVNRKIPTAELANNGWFIYTLCLLISISALAIDVSLPAIPLVAEALGAGIESAQLTISIYLAGFACGQIPVGLLADRFGRRPVIVLGLLLFTGAALIGALSMDIRLLLLARFIQGLGGSVGPVLSRAMVRDVTTGNLAAKHMSLMVTALGVATLLGPIIGSGLILLGGWRSTYFFSVFSGVIILLLVAVFVPETRRQTAKVSALSQLKSSFNAFFSSRQSLLGLALVALPFGGYMTIVTQWSSVVVDVYKLPPIAFGPIFALAAVAYTVGAMLSKKHVSRYGVAQMLKISIYVFTAATLFLLVILFLGHVSLPVLWMAITVYLLGIGLILPNATAWALDPLPQAAGFGASIVGTAQIAFSSLLSSIAAAFYTQTIMSMTVLLTVAGALTVVVYVFGQRLMRQQ
ncbi:MAG: multidrug effflux MFS transporter [Desulfuromonadales bacterium]|nr:multidrug effflux MFS transporter [Desulfuromonadales bacterium]